MKIQIDSKIIIDALTKMQLKGKYYTSGLSKNSSIGSQVVICAEEGSGIILYNANHVAMCLRRITTTVEESGECVVDADKVITQMKAFKGTVTIEAGEVLTTIQGSSKMRTPLLLNHSSPAAIAQVKGLTIPSGIPITIGRKTEIKTHLLTSWVHLSDAVKGCDVLNIGRYKFNFNEEEGILQLSSNKTATESFSTQVTCGSMNGEGATVEMTGPFLSFFEKTDVINIYMRDDSPILFASNQGERMLVKAPYIGRN
jgi:hypothetical protein